MSMSATCEAYSGAIPQFCGEQQLPLTGFDPSVVLLAAVAMVAAGSALRKLSTKH